MPSWLKTYLSTPPGWYTYGGAALVLGLSAIWQRASSWDLFCVLVGSLLIAGKWWATHRPSSQPPTP